MKQYLQHSLLLCALLSLSHNITGAAVVIDPSSVLAPAHLGKLKLTHNGTKFHVLKGQRRKSVPNYRLDPSLRNIKRKQLEKILANGYIAVNQSTSGEYSLQANQRIKGGGAFGAWLGTTIGYGAVTLTGHSLVYGASFLAGPLQPAAHATLIKMFAVPIHKTACAAGIGLGISGAVATGPV